MISLARQYFGFDPPSWKYSAVSPSPTSLASRNATLLQTYAGSARLSRVRLIETDALSWLRGAARPDLRPLTTNLLAYVTSAHSRRIYDLLPPTDLLQNTRIPANAQVRPDLRTTLPCSMPSIRVPAV